MKSIKTNISLAMDTKIKVLIAGDVCGKFKQLFQRVEAVNKKAGPFEILLCTGDFFAPENNDELIAYKNGYKHIPVPTYILGANNEALVEHYKDIENGEICENLTYLGKRGVYTLSSGVKIVYLSGVEGAENNEEPHCFNKADVVALRNSCLANKSSVSDYKGVDILLTSQWPYGIMDSENASASKLISFLSKEIKPRYHFCGLNGKYFEAPPHRTPADHITQLELSTRFMSMAAVGNAEKQKFVFALSLTPVDKMRVLDLIQKTTNEVKSPYVGISLAGDEIPKQANEEAQYFYDMPGNNRKRDGGDNRQKHNKRPKIMNIDEEKCWFCLSSPDVEKHLVISIGDTFYLALAKGPINNWHVLIISVVHIRCAAQLDESGWQELKKFKQALRDFFKSEGLVVCYTERNYKSSHLVINALGIDEGYAWKIRHSFDDKAEEFNLPFDVLPKLSSPELLPPKGPYFVAELPDDSVLLTRQMKQFPLHFARDVFCAANLLNCEEKVDWKDCKLEKDEEIALVKQFREKFAPFDFTLQN